MEFLYKLYSNNYFGIGLFIVITVLAFSFLVILFFGKKDEKKRKLNEELKEINNSIENKEDVSSLNNIIDNKLVDSIKIEDEENKIITNDEPIFEMNESETFSEKPFEDMDEFVTSNLVLNSDLVSFEEPEEVVISKEERKSSDIYNLDSLMNETEEYNINMEDETIDDVLNKYDAIEEKIIDTKKENTFDVNKKVEIKEESNSNDNFFEKSIDNNKKSSTPFSSVYLTKDATPIENQIEKTKEEPVKTSTRPTFDLPKRMDLPKRNTGAINENIISSMGLSRETNRSNNDNSSK